MRIAFALLPEKGHINPYIGPAQALADAGHEVVVAAPGDIQVQITRAGLTFDHDLIPPVHDGRVTGGSALLERVLDADRLDRWIEQLLLSDLDPQVDALCTWLQRSGAGAVVIDPLYYAAAIAAHRLRLPWAAVSNSLNPVLPPDLDSALLTTVRRLHLRRSQIFQRYGMDAQFRGCDVLSPHLTVAFTTEAFVGAHPGVALVGPSFPRRDRGDEVPLCPLPSGRPIVYASFGSQLCLTSGLVQRLIDATGAIGAHLVIAAGDQQQDWESNAHCTIYRYAPQLSILRKASALITHGGANSVMEAIACGVPMLVSPVCNDQFHQAYFIRRSGIGVVDNLLDASADLQGHLERLLNNSVIRSCMNAVSASYGVDGAANAAALIAKLA